MTEQKVTVEAKSIEEAMVKAANELGVDVGAIEYEVVKKSGGSFFGIFGGGKVEIVAKLAATAGANGSGRRKRRERSDGAERSADRSPDRSNDRGERGQRHSQKPRQETSPRRHSENGAQGDEDGAISAAPLEPEVVKALTEELRMFCSEICRMLIGDNVEVTAELIDTRLMLNINDDRIGDLLNKNTKLAEGMEHILRKKPRHLRQELPFRIFLDAGGVRKARELELIQMAQDLSLKVHENKKPIVLNYKSSYDRKIIHMALDKDDRVYTKSIGSGPNRKLMILPSRGGEESADA